MMNEEADDLGFMRDVSEFFGAKATEDELAKFNEGRVPNDDKLVLRDGIAVLKLDEPVFAKLYRQVWADVRNEHRELSSLGVGYLAGAAENLGLKELGGRLRAFQREMPKGLATIRREDGSLWSPTPVQRVPARATNEEREALTRDIEAFLRKAEDDE